MKVSGSFLKSNFDLKTTITRYEESIIDYIHVDMMDGKFVKNKTFTMGEINKLLGKSQKPLDVHLMIKNPLKYLEDFALLNTEYYIFHFEAVSNVMDTINKIKEIGLKVGISIKPKTKIKSIKEYLPYLDQILVMSVEPGKGGQTFIEKSLAKIIELKELKTKNNYTYIISVDGGIDDITAPLVNTYGADMVVGGSYICADDNFNDRINKLI